MSTLQTITIEVVGITPLLMHNPAGSMGGGSSELKSSREIYSAEDDADQSCYKDANGGFYLPTFAFRSCILSAARGRKLAKFFATTVVKGAVFAADERTPLLDPSTGEVLRTYEIDTRRAVIKSNGILRSRAKLPVWACAVNLDCDLEFISEAQVRDLLTVGGRIVGVGDFRPECQGPFGRFRVKD